MSTPLFSDQAKKWFGFSFWMILVFAIGITGLIYSLSALSAASTLLNLLGLAGLIGCLLVLIVGTHIGTRQYFPSSN